MNQIEELRCRFWNLVAIAMYDKALEDNMKRREQILLAKERELDQVINQKEQEIQSIIIHTVLKLHEKNLPIIEIAECLGIGATEVKTILEERK